MPARCLCDRQACTSRVNMSDRKPNDHCHLRPNPGSFRRTNACCWRCHTHDHARSRCSSSHTCNLRRYNLPAMPISEQHLCVSQRSPLYPWLHVQVPSGLLQVPPPLHGRAGSIDRIQSASSQSRCRCAGTFVLHSHQQVAPRSRHRCTLR